MDSIETQLKKNQVWRPNLDQFARIESLGTELKLGKAKLVQSGVQLKELKIEG